MVTALSRIASAARSVARQPQVNWVGRNLDPVLAIVLAVTFLVLSSLDLLKEDALFQATAGLLVVFAVALFRERSMRERAVRRIERVGEGMRAPTAWEVIESVCEWNLLTSDGSRAEAAVRKQIRVLANQVYSVYEFYDPDGDLGNVRYQGNAPGESIRDLPEMHARFPGPQARRYRVISLERMLAYGDRFHIESRRQLDNCFPEQRESVRVEIEVPTQLCTLRVTWPQDRRPATLEIERTGARTESVPTDGLKKLEGGGWRYERSFSDPKVDESFMFVWTW
jgi:hypothetical protein